MELIKTYVLPGEGAPEMTLDELESVSEMGVELDNVIIVDPPKWTDFNPMWLREMVRVGIAVPPSVLSNAGIETR